MACSERSTLWGLAAGELAADVRERLEQHLTGCDECRHELEAVKATREVLCAAAPVEPQVDWRRADEAVHGAVERRFARLERGWSWSLAFALGAGATAVVVAMFALARHSGPAVDPAALALVVQPVSSPSSVESADGVLAMVGVDEHMLKPGEDLKTGTALRTTVSGKAIFKLPEGSRVRVASATDLFVKTGEKEDVDLVLRKGRVAVKATHAARKEFVIEAGGVFVHVVGTAFSVGLSDDNADVAVTEGRVLVDFPDGSSKIVGAGERVVLDRAKNEVRGAALTASDKSEMNELGVDVAIADARKPRPSIKQPAAIAPVPMPLPEPERIPIEPPIMKPVEPVASAEPVVAPRPQRLRGVTVDQSKLHEVQFALEHGKCTVNLAEQLANMLEDRTDMPQVDIEDALILRARCLENLKAGPKADAAYRAYLREFAQGRYALEAHRSVAH